MPRWLHFTEQGQSQETDPDALCLFYHRCNYGCDQGTEPFQEHKEFLCAAPCCHAQCPRSGTGILATANLSCVSAMSLAQRHPHSVLPHVTFWDWHFVFQQLAASVTNGSSALWAAMSYSGCSIVGLAIHPSKTTRVISVTKNASENLHTLAFVWTYSSFPGIRLLLCNCVSGTFCSLKRCLSPSQNVCLLSHFHQQRQKSLLSPPSPLCLVLSSCYFRHDNRCGVLWPHGLNLHISKKHRR